MLINFIGCPASGKTTTAAMLFAKLKEEGIPSEFVCEEARIYIASMRYEQGLAPEDKLVLTDEDQKRIMASQYRTEEVMAEVCGPSVVVVSDSSALNALLYMTPECREEMQDEVRLVKNNCDLAFYLPPVQAPHIFDPNRVHDEAASLKIDKLIAEVFKQYASDLPLIKLKGDPQDRLDTAFTLVKMVRAAIMKVSQ